ncbi:MAG: serine hydrolase, partial [Alphaproteobacteria bacterium]|nr:serine hydrolase [Alphaproteobacteria bacterium]
MTRRWTVLAALCLLGLGGAGKPPATVQAWVTAVNSGNDEALKALGDESVEFDHDIVEETGGFTLLKIEKDDAHTFVAILREKLSPETWHVIFSRDPADPARFKTIVHRYPADPMHSMKDALTALNDFASRMAAKDKFSGTLEIAKDGKPLYAKAFGTMGPGRPANTLETEFHYASLGKLFTAVAVLQLVDAGKISLDTPIIKYLPDYPNKPVAREVTVRMLLMMRDGLGDINLLEPQYAANRAKVHSLAGIIALNAGHAPAF